VVEGAGADGAADAGGDVAVGSFGLDEDGSFGLDADGVLLGCDRSPADCADTVTAAAITANEATELAESRCRMLIGTSRVSSYSDRWTAFSVSAANCRGNTRTRSPPRQAYAPSGRDARPL